MVYLGYDWKAERQRIELSKDYIKIFTNLKFYGTYLGRTSMFYNDIFSQYRGDLDSKKSDLSFIYNYQNYFIFDGAYDPVTGENIGLNQNIKNLEIDHFKSIIEEQKNTINILLYGKEEDKNKELELYSNIESELFNKENQMDGVIYLEMILKKKLNLIRIVAI